MIDPLGESLVCEGWKDVHGLQSNSDTGLVCEIPLYFILYSKG